MATAAAGSEPSGLSGLPYVHRGRAVQPVRVAGGAGGVPGVHGGRVD